VGWKSVSHSRPGIGDVERETAGTQADDLAVAGPEHGGVRGQPLNIGQALTEARMDRPSAPSSKPGPNAHRTGTRLVPHSSIQSEPHSPAGHPGRCLDKSVATTAQRGRQTLANGVAEVRSQGLGDLPEILQVSSITRAHDYPVSSVGTTSMERG